MNGVSNRVEKRIKKIEEDIKNLQKQIRIDVGVVNELKKGFKLIAAAIATAGGGGTQGDWTAEEEAVIQARIEHLERLIAPRPDPVPADKK